MLPAAVGARWNVAAAADRAGIADRRRARYGCAGVDGSDRRLRHVSVLVVTGTDTGVGKTVATAALACAARLAGIDVVVCKPVQTGCATGDDDIAEVVRLSGVDRVVRSWRYPERFAPVVAAQWGGLPLPNRVELDVSIRAVDRSRQLTLVEGAG